MYVSLYVHLPFHASVASLYGVSTKVLSSHTYAMHAAAFGKFEEDQGYGGHVQGANYMADLLRHGATGQKLTKYYNRRMCGVGTGPANSACADHCHKPTKRIHENGEQSAAPLAGMHRRLVRLQKKVSFSTFQSDAWVE